MLVVIAEGNVVLRKLLPAAAVSDPVRAARVVADAVHEVAREAGGYPRRVLVREWTTAAVLTGEVESQHVDVRVSGLRRTARIIRDLAARLDAPDEAWDLSPFGDWAKAEAGVLDGYLRAAGRFWRARPWTLAGDREVFIARVRDWDSVVVLTHPRRHGHALTVYASASDFPDDFGTSHPVLGVEFIPRRRASSLLESGLELPTTLHNPDPRPYPLLLEGGNLAGEAVLWVNLVTAALTALATMAESSGSVSRGLRFRAENGVELLLESDTRPVLWPAMRKAAAGCATGPAADPEAALHGGGARLESTEEARLERFAAHVAGARTRPGPAARHLRHARDWTRFLAGVARVPAIAATELDLRTFLYDWWPRTTRDDDASARALPASLARYFAFLEEHEGITYPWAAAVLRERAAFLDRLETAPLGPEDDEELQAWLEPLHADLDGRALLPGRSFPGAHAGFDPPRTPEVSALAGELLRWWQIWRDEVIRAGVRVPEALRAKLVARQREWERTPHPHFGRSPMRVLADAESGDSG
ncbi:MAG TPA: hypothetical protein VJT67_00470 [Longimicrobiaceae bacterium]|nr:hypothetical protein [Longimicrobiaceae bacterium]